MFRKELYLRLDDVLIDFGILKNRINSYLEEQNDILVRLDKINNEPVVVDSGNSGRYGSFAMTDMSKNVEHIENKLKSVMNNKENMLKIELKEHIEGLEEDIRQTFNKFMQLNLEVKEAFYLETIKQKMNEK